MSPCGVLWIGDSLGLPCGQELYTEPYVSINWPSCRNKVSEADLYSPHSKTVNVLFAGLSVYERVAPSFIRRAALKRTYELIKMEDENTSYQTVGPVSKAIQMMSVANRRWRRGASEQFYLLHSHVL